MKVTILGTGTATPIPERNASGLVVAAGGSLILVDLGPGTFRRLCDAEIDMKAIDVILVTHFHPDHVSDLVPFLFASNYAYGPFREAPFHLVGPTGMEKFYSAMVAVYGHWIVPTNERLLMHEMETAATDKLVIGGVKILSAPSAHSAPSLSYRIEADGSSVTLSGDTDLTENLVELARDTDLLVCECSMPEGRKIPGHLVPSEAGDVARRAGAKRLVLTHFYPPCDEVDVAEQAAMAFSGEITRAEDLMVIAI